MVDDLRNHDAEPTREEREWMEQNVVGNVVRGLALGAFALAIGVATSLVLEPAPAPASVASSGTR